MYACETPSIEEAVAVAQRFLSSDEMHRIALIHQLRQEDELCRTVRAFNHLLDDPNYRPLGREALKSVGLEYGG